MTAVTSTPKKSFFGTNLKNGLISDRTLLIVNSALQLVGFPLIVLAVVIRLYIDEHNVIPVSYIDTLLMSLITVSIVAICISILSGIVIARSSFKYLYKKTLVDMNYSLPLTSRQRFFSNYLSGLIIYMVPAVAALLLGLLIAGCGSAVVDLSVFWENIWIFLKAVLIIYIGMLLYFSLTVLVTVCCGSSFESIFGCIALNALIPGAVACTYTMIEIFCDFGFQGGESMLFSPLFLSTSPFGAVFYLITFVNNSSFSESTDDFANYNYIRWLVFSLAVIAVFTILSYFLYKHRKAESVSKPYVYKSFYTVIKALGVYCILSLTISFGGIVVASVFLCAIIYFILEVITRRGFRKFWISVINFAVTVAVVIAFCEICKSTEGFRFGHYVPNASTVDMVTLTYGGNGNISNITFRDRDVIRNTTKSHKMLKDMYYIGDDGESADDSGYIPSEKLEITDSTNIWITYYMKSGTALSYRMYEANAQVLNDLTKSILISPEYAENCRKTIMAEANRFNESSFSSDIRLTDKLLPDNGTTKTVQRKVASEIADAYYEDVVNMTEEDLESSPVIGYINECEIRECFTNTIKALEKEDLKVPGIDYEIVADTMRVCFVDNYFSRHCFGRLQEDDSDDPSSSQYTGPYHRDDKKISSIPEPYCENIDSEYFSRSALHNDLTRSAIEKAQPYVYDSEVSGIIILTSYDSYYYEDSQYMTSSSCTFLYLPKNEENDELMEDLVKLNSGDKDMFYNGYDYYDDNYDYYVYY